MRKSLHALAVAGLAATAGLGLSGCGSSGRLAGPTAAPVTASPSAAEAVLARNYFSGDQAIAFPPSMTGITSAARGFNGNAEQVAVVYATPADAEHAVTWYQGQDTSLGGTVVVQASGPVITITGDDVHMATYISQITGYN